MLLRIMAVSFVLAFTPAAFALDGKIVHVK